MNDKHRNHIYKKEIADYYSQRSQSYDQSNWHDCIAKKLVETAKISPELKLLDIATGTGVVAMYAAAKLGPSGSIIGVDISKGMISTAISKIPDLPTTNIHFELGDGEELHFAPGSFDLILCGSAFIWMNDLLSTLIHWKTRLKPKGRVGINAFSENAFVTGVVAQKVLHKYGVTYQMSKPTGSAEKCHHLFDQAGFKNIEVIVDEGGNYIDFEQAKKAWNGLRQPAPGQYPHPMANMTDEEIANARSDFEHQLEILNTDRGIWNDMTTFYVFGEIPDNS